MDPTVRLIKSESRAKWAPFRFGQHPDFEKDYRRCYRQARRKFRKGQFCDALLGREIHLRELTDPRHPDVFIIPRNRHLYVVDEWGDAIGFERRTFPFSSTDFYVDLDRPGLFHEFGRSAAFSRLGQINQLGYLVPPRPDEWDGSMHVAYLIPQFYSTRWDHSLLVAIIMEITLARNDFSKEKRIPVVLTAGCHDIATPAGGDSIKRVDPKNLDEEENFSWLLEYHNLAERWAKQFGFNLALAQSWVKGEGLFGRLLDVIDKISYTAIDCYHLGLIRAGKARKLCLGHPLIMDVWQSIRFSPDQNNFAFTQPEQLFWFLLLRAYEYQEFLFNPYCRALDLFLNKLVKPLYKAGIITKEQLLTHGDDWLNWELNKYYPEEIKAIIEPEEFSFERFETAEEQREFCVKLGERVERTENITGFTTGLDWSVFSQEGIVPLRRVISQEEIELLEGVADSTKGYYVYYRL